MGVQSDSDLSRREVPTILQLDVSEVYENKGGDTSAVISRLVGFIRSHFGYRQFGVFVNRPTSHNCSA